MKKILVVVESINVNDSSASKGRVALIKNLQKCNYDLKVYHYTRKDISIEGIPCVAIKEKRFTLLYIINKLQLIFYKITKIRLSKYYERLTGFSFSFRNDANSIRAALKKENDFNPDWVLTLSKAASFTAHKAVLRLPKWHSKWLAYVHDPYPFHFYPRPYNWVEPGYYQKQEFFRAVSKKCAYGIFPSLLLKEWMGSYFPDFLERGRVIPHQIIDSQEQLQHPPDYFNKNGFTILHAGNLMRPRNPRGLIEAFKQFLKNYPESKNDTQLLFIGSNATFEDYFNKEKEVLPQLYISDGSVAYDNVQSMQNIAAVNVILEAKAEISPFLPGKFPHCVSANRPILHLGPSLSETSRLLGKEYKYKSEIDDVDRITEHLEDLYLKWKANEHSNNLNRPDLVDYLSTKNLKDVMNSLSSNAES
ncbi:UDP-glycosyltransferase [Winogradskyella ouciana]|uniref:UDP-glycosyltransferase n=1 Tax=Winogradskyella ouciana TaxID=2608631 RepID=A0A7K1GG53_9FLAO|nr:UDP-glycosyltransferase [Winogradskyella ouciana]MTE27388.1 UDP-glycosyltransferase [Winogradskyella ouciana]